MTRETGVPGDLIRRVMILGLGLVAGTVPLWVGPALFCTSDEQYCGLSWLIWGALALLVAGGWGAALGGRGLGLAAGLVGVFLGTAIAIYFESLTHTLDGGEAVAQWAGIEGLLFGSGYVVVWGIRGLVSRPRGAP